MIVARAVRRATAPGAPTLRNSVLAREAPAWIDPMAMSSSRTGTTGERGDARGMGIGVEECGQRAGPYVSSFARAACTVQHLAGGTFTVRLRIVPHAAPCARSSPATQDRSEKP